MKHTITTAIAMLFAGSLQAASDAEVYHGFAAGNPDLSSEVYSAQRPGSDSRVSYDALVYHGFELGNPELGTDGQIERTAEVAMTGAQPAVGSGDRLFGSDLFSQRSIYNGFEVGNPDL